MFTLFRKGNNEKVKKETAKEEDTTILLEVADGILRISDHTSIRLNQIVGVDVTFTRMIFEDHRYKVWLYTNSGGKIRAANLNVLEYYNAKLLAYDLKKRIESLMRRQGLA